MSDKHTITWEDIKDSADGLFNIWEGHYELNWAKKSWNGLVKQGLTNYSNDIERHVVLIRLLALANMYGLFCEKAFEESFDPYYPDWVELLQINPIRIGQLIDKNFEEEYYMDTDDLLNSSIEDLICDCKHNVFNALCKEFGNESILFVALWVTVEHDITDDESLNNNSENDINEELNEEKVYEERIENWAEYILNDGIYDKFEAYGWVLEGMW
jgi:hypothetical protein